MKEKGITLFVAGLLVICGLNHVDGASLVDRTPPDDVVKTEVQEEWTYPVENPITRIDAGINNTGATILSVVLAPGGNNLIRFYDVQHNYLGEIVSRWTDISAMDANYKRSIVAYGGWSANVTIVNITTKQIMYEQPQGTLNDYLRDIAISRDGKYMAIATSMNPGYNFFVYDIQNFPPSLLFGKHLLMGPEAVDFTIQNTVVVGTLGDPGSGRYEFMEFDLAGNERNHYDLGGTSILDICVNPKDTSEVMILTSDSVGEAKLLKLSYPSPPPQIIASYDATGTPGGSRCAFAPNGQTVAFSSWKGYFYLFNKTTGTLLKNFTHNAGASVTGLAWPEPGNRIFTGDMSSSGSLLRCWKDMVTPTIKKVTTWPSWYVSKTFDIEVEFSEEMLTEGLIKLTVGNYPPYQNFSITTGDWLDRRTWKGTANVPVGASEGVNHISISEAQDRAGNIMQTHTNTQIFIDSITPVVSLASSVYWVDGALQFQYNIDDGPVQKSSGIAWISFFYRQSIDNHTWGQWTNFSYIQNPPLSGTQSFTFPSDGHYQFYAVATDRAGNSNPTPGVTPMLEAGHDVTPPSASITSPPFYKNNRTFTLTYSTSDNLKMQGINITERFSPDNLSWSPEVRIFNTTSVFIGSISQTVTSDGFYRYTINARDERGNLASARITLAVDTKPPQVSLSYAGPYWVDGAFNVSYLATDEISLKEITFYLRNSSNNSTWGNWSPLMKRGPPFSGNYTVTPVSDGFFQLGVTASDMSGNVNTLTPGVNFGYDTQPPGISVSTRYWHTLPPGMSVNLSDNLGLRMIEISYRYSPDNISFGGWMPYSRNNLSGKSYMLSVDLNLTQEGYYIVQLKVYDLSGRNSSSTVRIGYDATPPVSRVVALSKYTAQKEFTITLGSYNDTLSGIRYVTLWYRKDSGQPAYYGEFTGGLLTFDTTHTGGDGNYSFWARGMDLAGNEEGLDAVETWTIVDTVPPGGSMLTPVANSTGVSVSTKVVIQFTESVDRGLGFSLETGGRGVPGSISWGLSDTRMTFTPLSDLAPGAKYWVNLTGGKDLAGNTLPEYTWWFVTEGYTPSKGSISGRVLDAISGLPLMDARVEAWLNGSLVKASMSNASGFYRITGLDPGEYELHVTLSGYTGYKTGVRIDLTRLDVTLDIPLTPEGGEPREQPNPLTIPLGGIPLWVFLIIIVLLVLLILAVARRRHPQEVKSEGAPAKPEKEETPKPIPQPEGVREPGEKPPSEEKPLSDEGFKCPICGETVRPSDRRCPGCKALIVREK